MLCTASPVQIPFASCSLCNFHVCFLSSCSIVIVVVVVQNTPRIHRRLIRVQLRIRVWNGPSFCTTLVASAIDQSLPAKTRIRFDVKWSPRTVIRAFAVEDPIEDTASETTLLGGTNGGHPESPYPTSHPSDQGLYPNPTSTASLLQRISRADSLGMMMKMMKVVKVVVNKERNVKEKKKKSHGSRVDDHPMVKRMTMLMLATVVYHPNVHSTGVGLPNLNQTTHHPTNHTILYPGLLGPIFPSSHQIRILAFTHSSRPGQFSIRTCSLGVSLRVHSGICFVC
ncbi:hypothetical protein F5890DRAFT_1520184 [Lentinula detonsa]|uniref:Uncharacterized protein n=1 Tax=Lentinula detonsa TaxID=2804962 RepID=A0AA38UTR0_9AGAR|nr:hypothetical protein F5890DRAFT_1520184 [Lentinula detonsa]